MISFDITEKLLCIPNLNKVRITFIDDRVVEGYLLNKFSERMQVKIGEANQSISYNIVKDIEDLCDTYIAPMPLDFVDGIVNSANESGKFIVMLSGSSWGATGGGQRPQQFANILSKDHTVLYIEPHGIQPRLVMEGKVWIASSNTRIWRRLREVKSERKVVYCCGPWLDFPLIMEDARSLGWTTHYDLIDDWAVMPGARYSAEYEMKAIVSSRILTASAQKLLDMLHPHNPDGSVLKLVRNCTSISPAKLPGKDRKFDAVFVGCLVGEWLDWGLIEKIAGKFKLSLVGAGGRKINNAHYYGEIPHGRLLNIIQEARYGIIPFNDTAIVGPVDPLKYYDYLISALPTIATDMPELYNRPFVKTTKTHEEFLAELEKKVYQSAKMIQDEGKKHTAEARVAEILELYEMVEQ